MDDPARALEEARKAGIDLSLLDANLALTVKERWEQHAAALKLALKLEEAGRKRDGYVRRVAEETD